MKATQASSANPKRITEKRSSLTSFFYFRLGFSPWHFGHVCLSHGLILSCLQRHFSFHVISQTVSSKAIIQLLNLPRKTRS
jgi:hypothetical protein